MLELAIFEHTETHGSDLVPSVKARSALHIFEAVAALELFGTIAFDGDGDDDGEILH